MRKLNYYLLAIIAWALCSYHLQAQVRIGDLTPPQAGALLDLNSKTESGEKGVLLLPNVDIKDLEEIPNSFIDISVPKKPALELTGLLVYNVSATTPKGLYYWNGSKWIPLFTTNK